jgi:hypothetical protein
VLGGIQLVLGRYLVGVKMMVSPLRWGATMCGNIRTVYMDFFL